MLSRRHPSDIHDSRLIAVLGKFLPPIIARSIVERARREAVSGPDVSWTDPNGLLDRISVGVRLFAAPDQQAAILRDITDLAVADQESGPTSRPLHEEGSPGSQLGPSSLRGRPEEPVATRREPPSYTPAAAPATAAPPHSAPAISGPVPKQSAAQAAEAPRALRAERPAPWGANEPGAAGRGMFATSAPRPAPLPQVRTYGARSAGAAPQPSPSSPGFLSGPQSIRGSDITPPTGMPRAVPPPSSRRVESSRDSREITIVLTSEHDIPRARQVAREICEALGTRALTQQRLVTIVSELGRNMVLYAGGGQITLRPPLSSNRRVLVLAVDHGPGIPNLPEILAGKYKSRSGLGLGIVGTKRLADSFHIETGKHGTEIRVEVIV